jgi:formylglycine-generating enzyme required for sulfatase activity
MDVFISYKSEERVHAARLAAALEAVGYSVWWDAALIPGDRFRKVIEDILMSCKAVVVVWSAKSRDSLWVIEEASRALDRGVLAPVRIERIEPPLGFGRSVLQTADVIGWDGDARAAALTPLLASLAKLVGRESHALPGDYVVPDVAALARPVAHAIAKDAEVAAWQAIQHSVDSRDFEAYLREFGSLGPMASLAHDRLAALDKMRQRESRELKRLPVGSEFRDAAFAPLMVVIPPGRFQMGSPAEEPGREPHEPLPQLVDIPHAFAVGRYPVTESEVAQWLRADRSAGLRANEAGFGGWPAVRINHAEAEAYCRWLSSSTNRHYRLLKAVEWEYCCRAGGTSAFATGDFITTDQANYDGSVPMPGQKPGQFRREHTNVSRFAPNAFGLAGMHGNVWEWIATAEVNNTANASRPCRGGSYVSTWRHLRASAECQLNGSNRYEDVGFRVARDLAD